MGSGLEFRIIDVLHYARYLCDTHAFKFSELNDMAQWHYQSNCILQTLMQSFGHYVGSMQERPKLAWEKLAVESLEALSSS